MKNNKGSNAEGYSDPTASAAISKIDQEEQELKRLKKVLGEVCALSGFRLKGQITVIDRKSGYSYRL